MIKKEHDKFTKLYFEEKLKREKEIKWNDRFVLEKIPQYDAFKDPNYMSLSLMKAKAKFEENNNANNKNKDIYTKKPMFSSHYCINSLSKQSAEKLKLNHDKALYNNYYTSNNYNNTKNENSKNQKLEKKRPKSIYLNRNKYSFISNSNKTNKNVFSNFINNKLKSQNLYDLENKNDYIYSNSRTTKEKDMYNNHRNIKFREKSFQGLNKESSSFLNEDKDLLKELNLIRDIWNQICVTQEYQNSFEEMCNSLNDKEELIIILNNEKKQITQFKNDLLKLINVISKREKSIEKIKKLDKIFIQNKELIQFNRALKPENKNSKKYQTDINLNCDDDEINESELEEKNNEQIEEDINNGLKSLRINTVNAVYQFNKFRAVYNFIMTSNKIDINKLQSFYGYNKDYLIKVKNDLDFLAYSNIRLIYNFQINDPFMIHLVKEKDGSKSTQKKTGVFKVLPASEELISTINNLMYILSQEELLFQMNFNSKKNKDNNSNKAKKSINKIKSKSPKEYNQLIFNNITTKLTSVNKENNNQELKEIPLTSASQLQKRFDFYEKLRQDLTDKNENNKNDINKKENLNENKNNEENKNNNKDNKNEEKNIKFNYIWYEDTFNKLKALYNEFYKKLSTKTINAFSLKENAEELIYGINSKIIICRKESSDKIYGICAVNYCLDSIDNNKLILKINQISSLEKDDEGADDNFYQKEKMEYKIYEQFIEQIKTLPYQIIEINFNINEKNKDLLNIFINKFKFKIEEEEEKQKENINNESKEKEGDNKEENENENIKEINKEDSINIDINNKKEKNIPGKKVLRLYNENNNNDNNNKNEEMIKKIKNIMESNEIKYNNTSILSIIEVKENQEKEKLNPNKYFYRYINTFNLNILINLLQKDNIYSLSDKNSSNEKNELLSQNISKYTSLFIKEQKYNLDNIINISADCSLLDSNDKERYTYINSILNTKIFPYLTIKYNKRIYNIFKINLLKLNENENIYVISASDEKISFYIYQIEKESDLKKELNKSNNEKFNVFEYFNKFINNQNEINDDFKSDNLLKKMLWLPSFAIDTSLICNKIPIFKDLVITNNNNEKFEIKEYMENLKISYGNKEISNNEILVEPNPKEDIIIDKDFIFAISHKNFKNQFNNSIAFLTYIAEDNFIKC